MANRYDFDDNDGFGAKLSAFWESVGPRVTVGAVTLAVVVLGAVIWTSYPDDTANGPDQAVPIVRADAGDFKALPDDPGGMQIAHRDSTVFEAMGNGSEEGGVENLLAEDDSEEPLPKSQLFAGLNTDPAAETDGAMPPQPRSATEADNTTDDTAPSSIEQAIANDLAKTEPAAGATPAKKPEIDMAQAAQVAAQLEPTAGAATTAAAEPKAAAKEAEKAATIEPAAGGANFYVQVGSVREQSGADSEWKKIQAKYNALNDMSHRVERADLGAKGTFYRIQAGPVSKDKAASACDAIKKVTPGGCLVVAD